MMETTTLRKVRIYFFVGLIACSACSRAKELFTKEWTDYETKVTPVIQPLKEGIIVLQENMRSLNQQKLNHPLLIPVKEKVDVAVAELSQNIQKMETTYEDEKQELTSLLENGKIDEAKKSFEEFKGKLDTSISISKSAYEHAQKEYADLSDRIDHREKLLGRFASQTGSANFSSIAFKSGKAEFDLKDSQSDLTLADLVQFAKTCKELRFEIAAHLSKEGKEDQNVKLTIARAKAVKLYLLRKGVPKAVIAETYGLGSSSPLLPEPGVGTAEEKTMDKDALEAIRKQNRRIQITVTEPCIPEPATTGTIQDKNQEKK